MAVGVIIAAQDDDRFAQDRDGIAVNPVAILARIGREKPHDLAILEQFHATAKRHADNIEMILRHSGEGLFEDAHIDAFGAGSVKIGIGTVAVFGIKGNRARDIAALDRLGAGAKRCGQHSPDQHAPRKADSISHSISEIHAPIMGEDCTGLSIVMR